MPITDYTMYSTGDSGAHTWWDIPTGIYQDSGVGYWQLTHPVSGTDITGIRTSKDGGADEQGLFMDALSNQHSLEAGEYVDDIYFSGYITGYLVNPGDYVEIYLDLYDAYYLQYLGQRAIQIGGYETPGSDNERTAQWSGLSGVIDANSLDYIVMIFDDTPIETLSGADVDWFYLTYRVTTPAPAPGITGIKGVPWHNIDSLMGVSGVDITGLVGVDF